VQRAADYGIPHSDIVVDPLVMPIGALGQAGRSVFHLIRRLRNELKVNTTCGASNISFGLPNRHGLNSSFLAMAIGAGMTSAITNPLHLEEMIGVMGGDVLMGSCSAMPSSSNPCAAASALGACSNTVMGVAGICANACAD
jgi:5-methyltetrahydrofolate--homocysteine methyltransferase